MFESNDSSEEKLSIPPEIYDISKETVAIFTLTDGTLKITCDGYDELVTVSTNELVGLNNQ